MNEINNTLPRMRTIREAAREVGIPEHALRVLVKEGRIVHIKVGCKALINMECLIQYLNKGDEIDDRK